MFLPGSFIIPTERLCSRGRNIVHAHRRAAADVACGRFGNEKTCQTRMTVTAATARAPRVFLHATAALQYGRLPCRRIYGHRDITLAPVLGPVG